MLIFYNNFFPACPEILFDKKENKGYTLIKKCGSTSLSNLVNQKPQRYNIITSADSLSNITVFIRDPIERYASGLVTQQRIYGITDNAVSSMINEYGYIPFIDGHTIPQFWNILRLGLDKNIQFTFKDISLLSEVDDSILNANKNKNTIAIPDSTIERLSHFFTEDTVLYKQFLNTTTTLDVIITAIKQEKIFISDIEQYKKVLNYLF